MNVGEIEVHIASNATSIRVTHDDIRDLEAFNAMLFGQLLKLIKSFLIVDKANKENSYFVVPTQVGKTVLVLLLYKVPVCWKCDCIWVTYACTWMMIHPLCWFAVVSAGNDGHLEVMWDVVRQFTTLPEIQAPTLEERHELQVTDGLFEGSVVAPWYRGMTSDQVWTQELPCSRLHIFCPFLLVNLLHTWVTEGWIFWLCIACITCA